MHYELKIQKSESGFAWTLNVANDSKDTSIAMPLEPNQGQIADTMRSIGVADESIESESAKVFNAIASFYK